MSNIHGCKIGNTAKMCEVHKLHTMFHSLHHYTEDTLSYRNFKIHP